MPQVPVRVAILDSGVTADHPHIANVAGGVAITPNGLSDDYLDWLGHGTAVAAAIHEKAPQADLLIVKIFGRKLSATIEQLVAGIEWALDQKAELINLSLGTRNERHRPPLQACIDRAARAGARIISARQVNGEACFPGSMDGVVGVEADSTIPRNEVRLTGHLAVASPYPRPIPGVPPDKNLHGISFAVANVTGFLAKCP